MGFYLLNFICCQETQTWIQCLKRCLLMWEKNNASPGVEAQWVGEM